MCSDTTLPLHETSSGRKYVPSPPLILSQLTRCHWMFNKSRLIKHPVTLDNYLTAKEQFALPGVGVGL